MAYLLAGDDTGLIKRVRLRDGALTKYGSQQPQRQIHALQWAGIRQGNATTASAAQSDDEGDEGEESEASKAASTARIQYESELLVGLKNGMVELWNMDSKEMVAEFDALSLTPSVEQSLAASASHKIDPSTRAPKTVNAGSKLIGMAVLQSNSSSSIDASATQSYTRRLLTCANSGILHIRPFNTIGMASSKDEMEDIPTVSSSSSSKKSKKSTSASPALSAASSSASFTVGGDLSILKVSPSSQQTFACGGKEHLLRLWDINTATETWREKNVKHDELNLRQQVWITDLAYVPGSADTQLVTGTAFHQVRHYDIRAQKRAMYSAEIGDHAVTCIDVSHDAKYIIVGDGSGRLQQLDLRKNARMVHVYHGIGGSVRGIQSHASEPLLAACGLDRFLRVYDVHTRKQLHKIYLKQKLNCCLFSSVTSEDEKRAYAKSEEAQVKMEQEDEQDELWKELNQRSTKQKSNGTTATAASASSSASSKSQKRKATSDDVEEDDDDVVTTQMSKKTKVKIEPVDDETVPAAASSSASKKKISPFMKIATTSATKSVPVQIKIEDDDEDEDGEDDNADDEDGDEEMAGEEDGEEDNEGGEDDEEGDDEQKDEDDEEADDVVPSPEPTPSPTPARATRKSTRASTHPLASPALGTRSHDHETRSHHHY